MRGFFIVSQKNIFYRCLSGLVVFVLTFSLIFSPTAGYAQSIFTLSGVEGLNLPVSGTMIHLSPAFAPVLLKGMTIHPNDPLKFDFIIDSGNTYFTIDEIKKETERLVKYFLASMTVPKDDLWVNLSPYENDRIIPDELGKTELGRDMLAQDYILKQLTASLMYPEKELGEKFWDKVYQKAEEQFGTSEIPVNTFNKVWILPENATVYEHEQTVYVVDAKLKVMLDSDYLAMDFHQKSTDRSRGSLQDDTSEMSESIIREIIIPEIEREVNEGEHFATLRQIYHSLILAKWYKETIKNSLLSQVYVDQNKIAGVDVDDKTIKDQIYARYMEAYKKGVFNYIKEDYDRLSQKIIPRKYFSGGLLIGAGDIHRTSSPVNESKNPKYRASVEVAPQKLDQSSSLAIMEGKNRLSSIKNEKYLNDIIQEAKISKGEIYPRAKEVLGAVEGDEVYILVRVPEDFLGREGLEVWIHSDLNDPNWRDEIKMDKLVKSGQDDRFIGKLKLARVGIVQYTGHWVVREDGKIIDEGWAKLPFRNGSLKNGTFVVRTRRAPVKVSLSEEEKIILESYRKESKELGIYSRYREELFIEKQLGSFLELYKKHKLLIGEIRIGNLLNKYLLSLMKYFEKTDKNFLPSQQQSEAIEEANRILSGFYKAKIDLRPLILWGNNDAGGSAIKLLRFILLDKEKDKHDRTKLIKTLVHEFLHLLESDYEGMSFRGLNESRNDYFTMVIFQNYDLNIYGYQEGIRNISMLLEVIGFEKLYQLDIGIIEQSLGENGKMVFSIFNDLVEGIQAKKNYWPMNIAELLANKDNKKYMSLVKEIIELKSNSGNNVPQRSLDDIREEMSKIMNQSLPLPNLERQIRKVREAWQSLISSPIDRETSKKSGLSSSSVTKEEALEYGRNVKKVFEEKWNETRRMFSEDADPEEYKRLIKKNRDDYGRVLFINAPVDHDARLKKEYASTQRLVADHLNERLVEGRNYAILDQIHLTAANMEIAHAPNKLSLKLDDVFNAAKQDAEEYGLKSFKIKLIGPRLMPNSVVVMEYEILDSDFLQLRRSAEERIEKTDIGENKAFAPNIYHSTVVTITDSDVSKETLRNLSEVLDEARDKISRQKITTIVSTIQVSEYSVEDRQVLRSLSYNLPSAPLFTKEKVGDLDIPGQPVVRLKEHYTSEERAAVERSLREYQRLAGEVEELLTRPEGFMDAFDSLEEWNRDMEFDKEKPASKLNEVIQIYEKFDNAYTEVEDEFEELFENAREGLGEFNENGVFTLTPEINAVTYGFNDKLRKIIDIVSVIVTLAGLKENDISAEDLNKYYKNALQIEHKIKKYLQFIRHLNDPSGITPDSIKDNREEKSVPTYPYIFFLIPYKKLMMGESDQNRKDADASSPIDAQSEDVGVGGIDLNRVEVDRQGAGVDIRFDPVEVQQIIDMGIDGFAPVIINLVPLPSVLPLLGLAPQREEEEFELSRN